MTETIRSIDEMSKEELERLTAPTRDGRARKRRERHYDMVPWSHAAHFIAQLGVDDLGPIADSIGINRGVLYKARTKGTVKRIYCTAIEALARRQGKPYAHAAPEAPEARAKTAGPPLPSSLLPAAAPASTLTTYLLTLVPGEAPQVRPMTGERVKIGGKAYLMVEVKG